MCARACCSPRRAWALRRPRRAGSWTRSSARCCWARSASLIAAPLGVAVAVWLGEYGRPAALARAVESGIEMIAGAPSVVLAIFGLLMFSRPFLAFLSQTSAGGSVFGRSFLTAGAMMSLLALPLIVGATREGLAQVPAHVREASYALGQGEDHDDPQGAAALDPPQHRGRGDAGAGADHRRHGDRRDPARRDAAPGRRGRGAAALDAARHRRHADELRQILLARGRRQSGGKGLCGGVRAAADGDRAEHARHAHHARAPWHVRPDVAWSWLPFWQKDVERGDDDGGGRRREPHRAAAARAGSPLPASPRWWSPGRSRRPAPARPGDGLGYHRAGDGSSP